MSSFIDDLKQINVKDPLFLSHWLNQCMKTKRRKRDIYSDLIRFFRFQEEIKFYFDEFSKESRNLISLVERHAITHQEMYEICAKWTSSVRRFLVSQDPILYDDLDIDPPPTKAAIMRKIIEKDDIDSLKEMMKEPGFGRYSEFLFYRSCRFGSIQCFRHLLINGETIDQLCIATSFLGQEEEIIQICIENCPEPEWKWCLAKSIYVHNYKQIEWILSKNISTETFNACHSFNDFKTMELLSGKPNISLDPMSESARTLSWFDFVFQRLSHDEIVSDFCESMCNSPYPLCKYIADKYPEVWNDLDEIDMVHPYSLIKVKMMYDHGARNIRNIEALFCHREGVMIWNFFLSKGLCDEQTLIKEGQREILFHFVHFECVPFLVQQGLVPNEKQKQKMIQRKLKLPIWFFIKEGIYFELPVDDPFFNHLGNKHK